MNQSKTHFKLWIALAVMAILSFSIHLSFADDVYTIVVKKQEEKNKYRWTLADWFDTRDKMRLQDLWLALHFPSPYEFYLGGNYQFNQFTSGSYFDAGEVAFAAFVSIFGLEARYEAAPDTRLTGIFDLRVLGYHDQSSNVTLQAGLRHRTLGSDSIRNALAGVSFTIYLARPFGIEALYRHYFDASPLSSGMGKSSERYQGGAFLEFRFLRLYGNYFIETDSPAAYRGVTVGTKLYF